VRRLHSARKGEEGELLGRSRIVGEGGFLGALRAAWRSPSGPVGQRTAQGLPGRVTSDGPRRSEGCSKPSVRPDV
jgi:hypothetical protein